MICLQLFLRFFQIGALSFGGGYGMISLIRETVLGNNWLTEKEFAAFIAVSESTPGPLAINMAVFIGTSQGGIPGALLASLGVVLPALLIILLITSTLNRPLKYAGIKAFLTAIRPCSAALVLTTAVSMALNTFFGIKNIRDSLQPCYPPVFIFLILVSLGIIYKRKKGRAPSPILMILLSAVLGLASCPFTAGSCIIIK